MDFERGAFDWMQVRAFLATAEEGSYSAAARRTGSTQPTIGRQVAALEKELDVVLFERVGRGLELTPTGLELLEYARTMGQAALQMGRVATGRSLSLEGRVCISSGEAHAAYLLAPALKEVRRLHPKIQLEVIASNDVSDLARREADIALRNFRPEQPELISKKIRTDEGYLYASRSYVKSLGGCKSLKKLSSAEFIAFGDPEINMKYLNSQGLTLVPESFSYLSESQSVQWALVKAGAGVGIMSAVVGDAEESVMRLLPEKIVFPFDTWLTTHREVRTSRRVRAVFDLLSEMLQNK